MRSRTILITNYHFPATAALVRDFKRIGFRVVSPDSNWGLIDYFGDNSDIGSELISYEDYCLSPPGWTLITCKPHEKDLVPIARRHNDLMIINIAQQNMYYEAGISDIMICPDIQTFDSYPDAVKEKLLYFPRPYLLANPDKNVASAFSNKLARSYTSLPQCWPEGTRALEEFAALYPYKTEHYGIETTGGVLSSIDCLRYMTEGFITLSFKELEAYGLSCLESMMAGTPVASLNRFMSDKTLGRYFLDDTNAILANSIPELIDRGSCDAS